jgi:cation diffusion facilitator family transporter
MTNYIEAEKTAEKEKKLVALSSVLAAIFITAFKLVIGLLTHSLGILAEAAHSALDLVAAAVTFFAVRISGKAPDEKLMFGYGKVENLSALFETFLLLVTCVWIVYEAIQRLFFKSVQVETSIWSFVVMGTSIIVDISRSRALMKAAKKHGSQALEADALHFSTDVWSSAVVIGGLVLITIGELLKKYTNVPEVVTTWLHRADAIAALGVSIIVIYVSIQLGKRTIQGLLDEAPQGLHQEILGKVSAIPGLLKVRQVRIRPSGPSTFVDMILEIPRAASLEEAHNISVEAKKIVKSLITRVDVMIHLDPMVVNRDSIVESVQSVVNRSGLDVHSIRVFENESKINLDMHIEVPDTLTIADAHERVSNVEAKLREEIPNLEEISSHIEPIGDQESRRLVNVADSEQIRASVMRLPELFKDVSNCHNIILYREGDNLSLTFHCDLPPSISVTEAHRLTVVMEKNLRLSSPELDRIYIHTEPVEETQQS